MDCDVEPEDAGDRADERDDAPAAGEIASEVGAEGGDATCEGDKAHGLAEDGTGAIAADGDRLLGDLLEAAHAGNRTSSIGPACPAGRGRHVPLRVH